MEHAVRSTAYCCCHCNAVCCWECDAHDDSIDEVKSIGGRCCDEEACIAADVVAQGVSRERIDASRLRHKAMARPCSHLLANPEIEVVESSSVVLAGPPMTGRCSLCGADLDELRRRGKVGHACFGPGDSTNSDPPS